MDRYLVTGCAGFIASKVSRMLLEAGTGRQPALEHRPAHPADVSATWAKIDKARSLLDWQPETPVETGLAQCVAWYRENRPLAQSLELGRR